MKRSLLTLLSALALVTLPATGQAVVASIDAFFIDRNEANFFTDNFNDGLTPSQEARYSVVGSFPNGAEIGGMLTLDSAWGLLRTDAAGQRLQVLNTIYRSLLSIDDAIVVGGLFRLVVPTGPLTDAYGVQAVNARADGTIDLAAEIVVGYDSTLGRNGIVYVGQDWANGTTTRLAYVPLAPPPGADEVALAVFKEAGSRDFFGAYAFCSSGICRDEDFEIFGTSFALFGTTDNVVGTFLAISAVPEPGTFALLGFGLAGLAVSRRRRR